MKNLKKYFSHLLSMMLLLSTFSQSAVPIIAYAYTADDAPTEVVTDEESEDLEPITTLNVSEETVVITTATELNDQESNTVVIEDVEIIHVEENEDATVYTAVNEDEEEFFIRDEENLFNLEVGVRYDSITGNVSLFEEAYQIVPETVEDFVEATEADETEEIVEEEPVEDVEEEEVDGDSEEEAEEPSEVDEDLEAEETLEDTEGEETETQAISQANMEPMQVEDLEPDFELSLMHMNDTHARVPNYANMLTAIQSYRGDNPNSLLLHAGDVFSGTLYFNQFRGQADLALLNLMGIDAFAFGNHEFDLGNSPEGHEALANFVSGANFPFLSTNIDFSSDPNMAPLETNQTLASNPAGGQIYDSMVLDVEGEQIGIFGLTTEDTANIASPVNIAFSNYINAAEQAVAEFEAAGINKIVAVTHIGFASTPSVGNDLILASQVDGIDIIVGGHSHTALSTPEVVETGEAPTVIVQAGANADNLGTLNVVFNETGEIIDHDGALLETGDYDPDPAALEALAEYQEEVDDINNAETGAVALRDLENPRYGDGDPVSVRANETPLGNLITDAMLTKTQEQFPETVMAVQNGGGIRAPISAGPITQGEVIDVLPFGNNPVVVEMTGEEIKELFEISYGANERPAGGLEENGGFLHVSGVEIYFDSSRPAGDRVLGVFIEQDGNLIPIQMDEEYLVTTNAFTGQGGDSLTPFAEAYADGRVQDTGLIDWEQFRDYMVEEQYLNGEVDPEVEGRINNLNGEALPLEIQILLLENRIATLEERLNEFEEENEALVDEIAELQALLEALQADLEARETEISELEERIAELERRLAELEASGFELSLMHMNDTHARVEKYPQMVTAIHAFRAENEEALLLHAGDVFSGTLYFNEFLGQADLRLMNLMGIDAFAFGNHEFDLGSATEGHPELAAFVEEANFPFLGTNLDFSEDPAMSAYQRNESLVRNPEAGQIYDSLVFEVDGEEIGVFSLTTEDTANIASPINVQFENYINAAEDAVAEFEAAGIDKIIAVTHIGYASSPTYGNDLVLANQVEGIDIIVGGHSHTALSDPDIVNADEAPTVIVQAGANADNLGTLNVIFDENGEIIEFAGELLSVGDYDPDPEAAELLAPYKEEIDAISSEEIGAVAVRDIENPRYNENEDTNSVRANETPLGNLITDAMLAKTKELYPDTVIAVQNGGGIRAPIAEGEITVGEVIEVLPFGNNPVIVELSGQELKELFEISYGANQLPTGGIEENGGFLHVSGMQIYFDSTRPAGDRVVAMYVEIEDELVEIQPDEGYLVTTNAFTDQGGDSLTPFETAYNEGRVQDTGAIDWEQLRDYMIEEAYLDGIVDPELEGRIVDLMGEELPGEPTDPTDPAEEIAELERRIDELEEAINALETDNEALMAELNALRALLAELRAELEAGETSLEELQRRIADLEARLAALEEEVEGAPAVPTDPSDQNGGGDDTTDPGDGDQGSTGKPGNGVDKDGKPLPQTGTATESFALLGVTILSAGGVLYVFSKRKKVKE